MNEEKVSESGHGWEMGQGEPNKKSLNNRGWTLRMTLHDISDWRALLSRI